MYDDNILESIKKLRGIPSDVTEFDLDIVSNINYINMELASLGILDEPLHVDKESVLEKYLTHIPHGSIGCVIPYLDQSVRLRFDPPKDSGVLNALQSIIKEMQFRWATWGGD